LNIGSGSAYGSDLDVRAHLGHDGGRGQNGNERSEEYGLRWHALPRLLVEVLTRANTATLVPREDVSKRKRHICLPVRCLGKTVAGNEQEVAGRPTPSFLARPQTICPHSHLAPPGPSDQQGPLNADPSAKLREAEDTTQFDLWVRLSTMEQNVYFRRHAPEVISNRTIATSANAACAIVPMRNAMDRSRYTPAKVDSERITTNDEEESHGGSWAGRRPHPPTPQRRSGVLSDSPW